jgi:hypothetical protein
VATAEQEREELEGELHAIEIGAELAGLDPASRAALASPS